MKPVAWAAVLLLGSIAALVVWRVVTPTSRPQLVMSVPKSGSAAQLVDQLLDSYYPKPGRTMRLPNDLPTLALEMDAFKRDLQARRTEVVAEIRARAQRGPLDRVPAHVWILGLVGGADAAETAVRIVPVGCGLSSGEMSLLAGLVGDLRDPDDETMAFIERFDWSSSVTARRCLLTSVRALAKRSSHPARLDALSRTLADELERER